MRELKNKKLFIFDMDGVLIDSSGVHAFAFEESFRRSNLNIPFNYRDFAGMKTRDVIHLLVDRHQLPLSENEVLSLCHLKSQLAFEGLEQASVLYPDIISLLEELKKAGAMMAIASSGSKRNVELICHRFGFDRFFSAVVSSEDISKAKPDPEIFIHTWKKFKFEKEQSVIIEDSIAGIDASKGAGIEVVAVATTNSEQQLKSAGADLILPSTTDLRMYL